MTTWQRPAGCESGVCVEVADIGTAIAVRDSKNPDGPALVFSRAEFAAFLNAAKHGEYDHLTRPVAP